MKQILASRRYCACFGFLAAAILLAGNTAAQQMQRSTGDWDVVCSDGKCRAGQLLANPKQPGIAYGSTFELVGKEKQLALQLTFPLGIYLPRGIGLRAGAEKRDVPVTVCLPSGCRALLMLDDKLTAALLKEQSYSVRFYTTEAAPGEVTFSLKGFPEARQAVLSGK